MRHMSHVTCHISHVTVFVLKPLEALLPWELDGTDNPQQTDIVTYRLNQSRGRFSDKPQIRKMSKGVDGSRHNF